MALRVSDVLGLDRLRALRAEGKDNAAILEEVNGILDPIKKNIGEDVYTSFSDRGISFEKMKEYADYQEKQAKEAAKAEEDKKYTEEVKFQKDKFIKNDNGTTPFENALTNNMARFASFINPINPLTDDKVDPYWAGIQQAMPELEKDYKKDNLDPIAYQQYLQDQKNIENADGILDTLGEVGKDMYHRLQNPSAINVPGAFGDMFTPENFIAGPAGGALAKVGTKVGTKLLSGAAAGVAADTTANYGYEYGVQKGLGASNKEAHKGASVQALAGVVPGTILGASGAGVRIMTKVKAVDAPASTDVDANNPNQPTKTLAMTDGTVLSPEEGSNPDYGVLPGEIASSSLLSLEKSANDTDVRVGKIAEISKTIADPIEKAKAVAEVAPASAEEHLTSYTLNDGSPVSDRLAGFAHVDALEKSILENKKTPQEIYYTLAQEGFRGENLNKMVESYIKKDINIYENWASTKLNDSTKGKIDARTNTGNGREDTTVQTDRASTVTDGARKTANTDTNTQTLQELTNRDRQDNKPSRLDTGNLDKETDIPTTDKTVAGQPTPRDDVSTLPGDRKDKLVQNENGVLADAKVESPTAIYNRLKDEPAISGEEKSRLRQLSEDYDVEQSSMSDGVINRYDNGFEIKSYPLRVKKIDELMTSSNGKKLTYTLSYADDVTLKKSLGYKNDIAMKRVINNSDIKHIFKQHGDNKVEASRGQIAIDKNDIANYPNIVRDADIQGIVVGKNNVKKVLSAKQVNGYYIVVEEVSTKKNTLNLKTMWKVKGKIKADTLRSVDGESPTLIVRNALGYEPNELMPSPSKASDIKSIANNTGNVKSQSDVVVDNVGGLLRTGAKSTESRNLKPVTLTKSIAEKNIDVKDIKTRDQLLAHRYYDDVLKSVQRSDNPSQYTSAQIESLKNRKLDNKLATKFREDMRTYAKNPKYAKQRAKTDVQFRELNDVAEILSQMKLDDALDLVESDSFKKGFDEPLSVHEMVVSMDDLVSDVGKKVDEPFNIKEAKKEVKLLTKEYESLKRAGDTKEILKVEKEINEKKSLVDYHKAIKRMEDNC